MSDCEHPEESLRPLPYRGRPPRADEWECGECGAWNVAKETEAYVRRAVDEPYVSIPGGSKLGTHTSDCVEQQEHTPTHIGTPREGARACVCLCHDSSPYYSDMWVRPSALQGSGYLSINTDQAQAQVQALVAQGKLRGMEISLDALSSAWTDFFGSLLSRSPKPDVEVRAVDVVPDAAVDVMRVMYDLVIGRGTKIVWEMSREMLRELQRRAAPPRVNPAPTTPTLWGGEIRVVYDGRNWDIVLRVRG